jgi:hypothetical protein
MKSAGFLPAASGMKSAIFCGTEGVLGFSLGINQGYSLAHGKSPGFFVREKRIQCHLDL